MYLIVGLGNPGKKFQETRHNIGFWVIYELAKKHGIQVSGIKHQALVGHGLINHQKVILAEPQTFMNLSGHAVASLLNYYRLPLENLIVIYDDLDLEFGRLRMRKSGGHGGHNGLRSLITCLKSEDFSRLRVGIGRPSEHIAGRDFVLSKFTESEKPVIEEAVQHSVNGIELWLEAGVEKAMNQVNRAGKDSER